MLAPLRMYHSDSSRFRDPLFIPALQNSKQARTCTEAATAFAILAGKNKRANNNSTMSDLCRIVAYVSTFEQSTLVDA
eukprot:4700360-Amphidinium_carterae.1